MLDLPKHSVLVGGLDHWLQRGDEVHEPRLLEKLKHCFVPPLARLQLFAPPPENKDPTAPKTGITAWRFPDWFSTQDLEEPNPGEPGVRSRLLVSGKVLTQGKFIDHGKRRRPVVPVRFVRACRFGHIGDIDWHAFVHGGATPHRLQLTLDERGTSGDLSEISVRCACGQQRSMKDAAQMELQALGPCDGSRLWLGPLNKENCGAPNRLLVRTAVYAYFAQTLSVISLPEQNEALVQAVNQVWEYYLANVDEIEDLQYQRRKFPGVQAALEGFSDEEVLQYVKGRKAGGFLAADKSVKQVEMETLSSSKERIGEDRPEGLFYARALPKSDWDQPWMKAVEKVVLVHRLREVIAQVGFTRFEPSVPDVEGELEMGVKAATLARELSWLPAVENRGEGIFIQFQRVAIEAWEQKPAVRKRGKQLLDGFVCWQHEHDQSRRSFSGLPFIMLHSLSHLLITAMSLECGYPASSIRERVYAGSAGFGILLYTASPDAEGTLGGLVEAGRRIAHHLKEALERGRLCSNDPVCAQHEPPNAQERRFLLGAACHGCLLIAETSCEQRNDFLDRAMVVPTVDNLGAEFFELG
jgi:hypothetical protein